ncbi:MAG: hypothetical protein R2856_22080 [Caldilineaceae bacterium]
MEPPIDVRPEEQYTVNYIATDSNAETNVARTRMRAAQGWVYTRSPPSSLAPS